MYSELGDVTYYIISKNYVNNSDSKTYSCEPPLIIVRKHDRSVIVSKLERSFNYLNSAIYFELLKKKQFKFLREV